MRLTYFCRCAQGAHLPRQAGDVTDPPLPRPRRRGERERPARSSSSLRRRRGIENTAANYKRVRSQAGVGGFATSSTGATLHPLRWTGSVRRRFFGTRARARRPLGLPRSPPRFRHVGVLGGVCNAARRRTYALGTGGLASVLAAAAVRCSARLVSRGAEDVRLTPSRSRPPPTGFGATSLESRQSRPAVRRRARKPRASAAARTCVYRACEYTASSRVAVRRTVAHRAAAPTAMQAASSVASRATSITPFGRRGGTDASRGPTYLRPAGAVFFAARADVWEVCSEPSGAV